MDYSPPGSSGHGDSPGKNTGVGSQSLLQGIFPTQRSNSGLLHCRQIFFLLSEIPGKPIYLKLDTNSTQQATHWVTGGSGLVTKLSPTLTTPQTVAHQALLSQGIPRQEYWSGLPFPSLENLPNPGLQCCRQSPALQANSLPTELLEKPHWETTMYLMHIVGWVL